MRDRLEFILNTIIRILYIVVFIIVALELKGWENISQLIILFFVYHIWSEQKESRVSIFITKKESDGE